MKRYVNVSNELIESGDKFLIQMYVAVQWLCKKCPTMKCVVSKESLYYAFGFPAERLKRHFPRLVKEYNLEVCKSGIGVVVTNADFYIRDIFQSLNDEEIRLLIDDAALLLHYLTLLKFAGYYKKAICGLNKLAESEGVSTRTIGDLNKKLVKLGLVEINRRMDKCNEYIIKYNEDKSELFG